jgi:hypothetical protein
LTPAEGNAAYQALDADLTSWALIARAAGFDTFATTPSSANLRALLTDESGTGALLFAGGNIGAATGTSLAVTGALTSSGGGVGYVAGAGSSVTQLTSKATGVTISKPCGRITMNGAALAAGAAVGFVVTNTLVADSDLIVLNHVGGGNVTDYQMWVQPGAGSFVVYLKNLTAGSLSDAVVINFALIKAVNA